MSDSKQEELTTVTELLFNNKKDFLKKLESSDLKEFINLLRSDSKKYLITPLDELVSEPKPKKEMSVYDIEFEDDFSRINKNKRLVSGFGVPVGLTKFLDLILLKIDSSIKGSKLKRYLNDIRKVCEERFKILNELKNDKSNLVKNAMSNYDFLINGFISYIRTDLNIDRFKVGSPLNYKLIFKFKFRKINKFIKKRIKSSPLFDYTRQSFVLINYFEPIILLNNGPRRIFNKILSELKKEKEPSVRFLQNAFAVLYSFFNFKEHLWSYKIGLYSSNIKHVNKINTLIISFRKLSKIFFTLLMLLIKVPNDFNGLSDDIKDVIDSDVTISNEVDELINLKPIKEFIKGLTGDDKLRLKEVLNKIP